MGVPVRKPLSCVNAARQKIVVSMQDAGNEPHRICYLRRGKFTCEGMEEGFVFSVEGKPGCFKLLFKEVEKAITD